MSRTRPGPEGRDYSEASIRVLKGLEPVRQRPGMYTRTDSPLHIVQEVIDNASDEVLAGSASRVDVTVHKDGAVTVEDDGRGIPAELLPRVFEPRFSTTTSGSGLGLAIARRLVAGWGGTIAIASTVGAGTTVTLRLAAPENTTGA